MSAEAVAAWNHYNEVLVQHLIQIGALTDRRWIEAFRATPRHIFVPCFIHDGVLLRAEDPTTHDEWLRQVYSDTSLVVQQAPAPGYHEDLPTS